MLNTDKVLAALNALNTPPVPFTADNIQLSPPEVYSGTQPYNTKITAKAVPTHGYSSQMDFFYHRIDLNEMAPMEIESVVPFTSAGILTVLNNLNGAAEGERADLNAADLQAIVLPNFAPNGDAQTVTLKAKSDSIGWTGQGDILLGFNLPDVQPLLDAFNGLANKL